MTPTLSWTHGLILLAAAVAFLWPASRIVGRAGFSRLWLLLCLVPGGAFVGFLLLAFVPWPALERDEADI